MVQNGNWRPNRFPSCTFEKKQLPAFFAKNGSVETSLNPNIGDPKSVACAICISRVDLYRCKEHCLRDDPTRSWRGTYALQQDDSVWGSEKEILLFQSNVSSLDFHFQFWFFLYYKTWSDWNPPFPTPGTQSDERSRVYTARGDFVRLVFQSLLGSSIPSTARNRYAQFREAAHHFWVPPART